MLMMKVKEILCISIVYVYISKLLESLHSKHLRPHSSACASLNQNQTLNLSTMSRLLYHITTWLPLFIDINAFRYSCFIVDLSFTAFSRHFACCVPVTYSARQTEDAWLTLWCTGCVWSQWLCIHHTNSATRTSINLYCQLWGGNF